MKRHGQLFTQICEPEHIREAYELAKKGKGNMRNVRRFAAHEAKGLANIERMLRQKTFCTSAYTEKQVFEPKPRTIYVLPFYPDRIVQHALMRVIAPIWQGLFLRQSYACIQGRGLHAGSQKTMEYVRRNMYCLKCDISKFYPSVDHEVLLRIIERKIKCPDTLWLIREIVHSVQGGKNVPIGNYTSQWMGNLYLNELDTMVKHELYIRDYLRYCDDFLLFHNDKAVLRQAAERIRAFCADTLKLRLSRCDLFPVSRGVDFLGYRHFREYILLRKRTAKRVFKRLRALPEQLRRGTVRPELARAQIASAWGWMKTANTYNMRRALQLDALKEQVDELCAV